MGDRTDLLGHPLPQPQVSWLPDDYIDELTPDGRPSPQDWIIKPDGIARLDAPFPEEDGYEPWNRTRYLSDGDAISFCRRTDYGEATLTVTHRDGEVTWTVSPIVVPNGCTFGLLYDPETNADSLDELVQGGGVSPLEEGEHVIWMVHWESAAALMRINSTTGMLYPDVTGEIYAERRRQLTQEGFTLEHDDKHDRGELASAAAAYAGETATLGSGAIGRVKHLCWPWEARWWKPRDRRRDLIRAAALIVAEIERLDRAAARKDRHNA